MTIVMQILITVMIILQIAVLIQMLYTTHKRHVEDTKFWKGIHEREKRIYESLHTTTKRITEMEDDATK